MKVHIRQIPHGETLHLEGQENPGALGLEEAGATPVSPLAYSLDVGLSGGGLFATGRLAITVRTPCVVCLKDLEIELVADPFSLQMDLSGKEQIDLTPFAREDMHLLLPSHPRCGAGDACSAGIPSTSSDSLREGDSAWDALDRLKT